MLFDFTTVPTTRFLFARTCFTSLLRFYSHAKRPPNSYLLFLSDFKSGCSEIGMKSISARAGRKWRSMTPEEKAPYEAEYQRALQNYLSEMGRDGTSGAYAHLSPKELSQLKEKFGKLKNQKSRLSSLQSEFKTIQEVSGMPKNLVTVVGAFLSSSGNTVNDGIRKWNGLSRETHSKYYLEASKINLQRKIDVMKWKSEVLKNNKEVLDRISELHFEIKRAELEFKKLKDDIRELKQSFMSSKDS